MTIYERRQCALLAVVAVSLLLFTSTLTIAVVRSADVSHRPEAHPAVSALP